MSVLCSFSKFSITRLDCVLHQGSFLPPLPQDLSIFFPCLMFSPSGAILASVVPQRDGCKTQRLCLLPSYLSCHMEPIPSEYRVTGRDAHVMQRKARVFGDCTGRMVDEILITSQVAGERTRALRDRRCRKGKSWKQLRRRN